MESRRDSRRPGINVMLGRGNAAYVDSFNSEIHSASVVSAGRMAGRPYWLYAASETVNSARTTYANQMAFDNDAAFLDNFWRYAHRSAPDGEIRAFQNMAHGAGPYLFINGSLLILGEFVQTGRLKPDTAIHDYSLFASADSPAERK